MAAYQQVTSADTIMRHRFAIDIDNLHVDAKHRTALLGLHRVAFLGALREVFAFGAMASTTGRKACA